MSDIYFKNKFCTIFTKPSQKSQFTKEEEISYFSGIVEQITDREIWISNIQNNKLKSCFYKQHVIAICEEEILDPKKEKDNEIISNIKKITKNEDFVDLNSLTELVNSAKIV